MRKSPPLLTILALAGLLASPLPAATALYKGRPIVRVASPQTHPNIGYSSNFGSAQFYADGIHYVALDGQATSSGLYFSGGAGPIAAASPTLALPNSFGTLKTVDYNFQSRAADGSSIFAAKTTADKIAYLKIDPQGAVSVLFDASTLKMPNSGDLPFTRLGEANAVGAQVAFLGFHTDSNQQTLHRGVYILENGALTTIADTNTVLPGGVGTFDGSSSQVGFDGTTVAFWGIHGTVQNNDQRQGIFVSTLDGPLTALAVDGDIIPGTATPIKSFLSPPHVIGANVYFGAFDANSKTYLLRSKNGILETLIKPDDTIGGHAITQIANAGFYASGDTVYFNATKNARSVILSQTGDQAPIVAIDDTLLPGFHQFAIRDVDGDRIIFSDSNTLYATLATPAVPVFTQDLTGQGATLDAGATLTLTSEAVGSGTLTYEWRLNNILIDGATGPNLEITDFQAAKSGYYSLKVTNANGTAYSPNATLLLNSKPIFASSETPVSLVSGFPLNLNLNIAGLTPMTYQWYKNGELVEGVATKNFYVAEASAANAGIYTQKATNSLGESTSADILVTITPAPENPAWAGRQFDTQFTFPITIDDVPALAFATTLTYPGGFIANTYDPTYVYNAILQIPDSGAPTALVTLASLNAATGKTYANIYLTAADPAGNILFYANGPSNDISTVFVREADGTLTTLVNKGDAVPGRPDKTFTGVYALAIDGDTRLYGGSFNGTSSLVVKVDAQNSTLLLDELTPLPADGFVIKNPVIALLENGSFYFSERTADNLQTAFFKYEANAEISLVVKTGDPIGDGSSTLAGYIAQLQRFKNKLYLYDSSTGIVEVGNRSATLALGPNTPVTGGGTMGSVSFFVAVSDTLAYLEQSYKPVEGSQRQAVFSWDGTDLRLVFSPTHIDQRRLLSTRFWALSGPGTLYTGVTFPDNTIAVLSNTGAEVADPDPNPKTYSIPDPLKYQILSKTVVRIFVPDGKMLQFSHDLQDPWTDIPGTPHIEVTLTQDHTFFRLRPLN